MGPPVVKQYVCNQRILMVDDEPYNLMAMRQILKTALKLVRKDCSIIDDILHEASFGQEAIDMFKTQLDSENPYVLIFMDCSMEPMDGYTASKTIKNICKDRGVDAPYIVATTGHSEEQFIQKAWKN